MRSLGLVSMTGRVKELVVPPGAFDKAAKLSRSRSLERAARGIQRRCGERLVGPAVALDARSRRCSENPGQAGAWNASPYHPVPGPASSQEYRRSPCVRSQLGVDSLVGRLPARHPVRAFLHPGSVRRRQAPRAQPRARKSARWPKSPRERRGAWSMATALRVRDAVNERNRIAVVVGPGRGLRQGEVFGLSPKDIDRERGMLHVRRQVRAIYGRLYFTSPKGKKIRTVDLPPRWPRNSGVTSKCSRQLGWSCRGGSRRGRGRSLPCCSPPASATPSRGTHGTPTPASRPWPRPVSSRHVPRGRKPGSGRRPRTDGFPVLRHTYASTMLEAGESVVTMARWLGHSSPAITLGYYAHFMPDAGSKGARHHRRSAWEGRGIGSLAETPQILPGAVDRRSPPLRPAVVLR